MKTALRKLLKGGLTRCSISRLCNISGTRPLSVFYHTAFREAPRYFSNLYKVKSPDEFAADIDVLLAQLQPLSLEDLLSADSAEEIPPNSFWLSFDDGYREVAEIIAPILRQKGVPATFFICSGLIDNQGWLFEDQVGLITHHIENDKSGEASKAVFVALQPFGHTLESLRGGRKSSPEIMEMLGRLLGIDWGTELATLRPYVTSEQIENLLSSGFSIGGHGVDHTVFHLLSTDEQIQQISDSCHTLSEKFNLDYRVFAFPYGEFDISAGTLQMIRDANVADCLFGTRGLIHDECFPYLQQRLWCENHTGTLKTFVKENLAERTLRRLRGTDRVCRTA